MHFTKCITNVKFLRKKPPKTHFVYHYCFVGNMNKNSCEKIRVESESLNQKRTSNKIPPHWLSVEHQFEVHFPPFLTYQLTTILTYPICTADQLICQASTVPHIYVTAYQERHSCSFGCVFINCCTVSILNG